MAARVKTKNNIHAVGKNHGVNEGDMTSLEGYFDNIAAAAANDKSVLKQLVANNTKLATTNEDLVAIIKKN